MDENSHILTPRIIGCRTTEAYEKTEQIGAGTYGQVWKARDKILNETVALKRIRMESEKEGFPITAIREIKILKELNHKNVVKIKEVVIGSEPDDLNSVYLVFEYMDHDLSGLLDSQGFKNNFREDQLKCYMKQLLEGLRYLHKNNILHRDIKAANLLISNKGILKLADFGLARPISSSEQSKPRYTNKVITLWYRPPELLLGATQYGPAIDIWSAGCILAELLEKKMPFTGNHKKEEEQLDLVWRLVGTPTKENWPNVDELPHYAIIRPKKAIPSKLKARYGSYGNEAVELLEKMLTLDPMKRIDAEGALDASFFFIDPLPCEPENIQPYHVASHEFTSRNRRKFNQIQQEQNQSVVNPAKRFKPDPNNNNNTLIHRPYDPQNNFRENDSRNDRNEKNIANNHTFTQNNSQNQRNNLKNPTQIQQQQRFSQGTQPRNNIFYRQENFIK